MASRAALVFLDELTTGGLMEHVVRVGSVLEAGLRDLAERHAVIREIRGAGLMWGIDLHVDAAAFVTAALQQGLLINRTAETVIRLLPPYVLTEGEAHEALAHLDTLIGQCAREIRT
jgi:acetylornithine/N-succinyldiaminopimelate aminotransferase